MPAPDLLLLQVRKYALAGRFIALGRHDREELLFLAAVDFEEHEPLSDRPKVLELCLPLVALLLQRLERVIRVHDLVRSRSQERGRVHRVRIETILERLEYETVLREYRVEPELDLREVTTNEDVPRRRDDKPSKVCRAPLGIRLARLRMNSHLPS